LDDGIRSNSGAVNKSSDGPQVYSQLFDACYETVKRAVRVSRRDEPEVYCRMTFAPGEEAQIDFGDIGMLLVDGQPRRVWLFSRYSYYGWCSTRPCRPSWARSVAASRILAVLHRASSLTT
jgi:hypothetical protein